VKAALSTLGQRQTAKAVHEARIAIRRLQASLQHLKHQLPSKDRKGCVVALSTIMKELNAVRDADVCSRLVRQWLIRSDLKGHEQGRLLRETADRERTEARQVLRRRIDAPKWSVRCRKLGQHELVLVGSQGEDLSPALIGSAREHYRRLSRDLSEAIHKPRQLHRLRLRIKGARYFLEDFGPLIRTTQEPDLVQLRGLQKTLGDLNDEWRLRRWLRGQLKCYLVTRAILTELKPHKRKLLKRIRRLQDLGRT
jgi:CHAD domain-containing protein